MTKFEEIQNHLTDLEIIAETLEETRKEAMLDMIDSFEASIKILLDEKQEEVETDDDSAEPTEPEPEVQPIAGLDN